VSAPAPDIDGYVTDTPYPSNFHQPFQVPWTQAVLVRHGLRPPTQRREPFTLVDIGCGDGIGLVVAAAAHPEGRFVGIDALPGHIARGLDIVGRLGLRNVELRCATFAEALHLPPGTADYAMAQGVLSWVSPARQREALALAARLLRDGGAFSAGYNALPGWGWLQPLQRLLRALSLAQAGDAACRFDAACAIVERDGLVGADVLAWLAARRARQPRAYWPHEFLNAHWQPHWCSDVFAAAASVGLVHAADALPSLLREELALPAPARQALAGITCTAARAQAADVLLDRRYRVDVFVKGGPAPLPDGETLAQRLATVWGTPTTRFDASLTLHTRAGPRRIDTAAARALLDALQDGPRALACIIDGDGDARAGRGRFGHGADAVLDAADALWMADLAWPLAEAALVPHAAAANALLRAGIDAGSDTVNGLAGRHGGVPVPRPTVAAGLAAPSRRRLAIP
jgi:SAM-dependent methyltransferase